MILLVLSAILALAGLAVFVVLLGGIVPLIGHFSPETAFALSLVGVLAAHMLAWIAKTPAQALAFFPRWSKNGKKELDRGPGLSIYILAFAILASGLAVCLALYYGNIIFPGLVNFSDSPLEPQVILWSVFYIENLVELLSFGALSEFGLTFSGISPGTFAAKALIWGHRIFLYVVLLKLMVNLARGYQPGIFPRN